VQDVALFDERRQAGHHGDAALAAVLLGPVKRVNALDLDVRPVDLLNRLEMERGGKPRAHDARPYGFLRVHGVPFKRFSRYNGQPRN
jgi:hypothetical protein